jgi:hypothetical protein
MIFVQWPLMGYALVPIIAVELLVFRRVLHLGYKPALLGSALANILSTVVGVPISWGVAYGLERGIFESLPIGWIKHIYHTPPLKILLFPLTAAWLGPIQPPSYWLVPCAAGILLIPCFFLSVWLERLVCRRVWRDTPRQQVKDAVYLANLFSYALLFLAACIWALYLYRAHHAS